MTFEPGDRVRTSLGDDWLPLGAKGRRGIVRQRHAFLSTLTGTDVLVVEIKGKDYGVRADRLTPA